MNNRLLLVYSLLLSLILCACSPKQEADLLQQLKSDFIEQRFGMFICYYIMAYWAKWSEAGYPIDFFNPQKLNCNQWAEVAVSNYLSYGSVTARGSVASLHGLSGC